MPNKHHGRGLTPTSSSTETTRRDAARAGEGELSHDGTLAAASLRRAGDEALPADGPASTDVPLAMKFRRRDLIKHDVFGLRCRVATDDDHYTLVELARYLRRDLGSVIHTAKRLRLTRKLPGDRRYRPLSRAQVKSLIQHVRTSRS